MNDNYVKNPRKLIATVARAMDWDKQHGVFGRPGTTSIPWLHKEPTTHEELAMALYEYLRSSGIIIHLEYHPEDVDIDMMMLANGIRKEAADEK